MNPSQNIEQFKIDTFQIKDFSSLIHSRIWNFCRGILRKPPKTGGGGKKITQAEMKSRMIKIDFENQLFLGEAVRQSQ
jgi:hypothetical protein